MPSLHDHVWFAGPETCLLLPRSQQTDDGGTPHTPPTRRTEETTFHPANHNYAIQQLSTLGGAPYRQRGRCARGESCKHVEQPHNNKGNSRHIHASDEVGWCKRLAGEGCMCREEMHMQALTAALGFTYVYGWRKEGGFWDGSLL